MLIANYKVGGMRKVIAIFFGISCAHRFNSWRVRTAPYIKPCKRSDPELNACITNSIENLRGKLAEGIPELEAPAIEPLTLNQIRLLRGPQGARLDINLTDIEVKLLRSTVQMFIRYINIFSIDSI